MASPQFPPIHSQEMVELIEICVKAEADEHEGTIVLIPGAYRDEKGKPWVMPFVLDIERKLIESATYNREYVIFMGLEPFKEMVPRLVLGEDSSALKSGRAFGVQTVSGTGALRIGGELLVRNSKFTTIYLSDPTWDNYELTFLYAGFTDYRTYRYWDPVKKGLDFNGMIEDLKNAPENAVIVLQVCAHNPTGCDLTREQWIEIADVIKENKLFPFLDAAYQGFGPISFEEDAWPVRYFVERGFELFVAQSFSKNMGLYGDRTGCLTIVLNEGRQKELGVIKLMLTAIIRALYLCPTRQGTQIVIETLKNQELRQKWMECLKIMRERLIHVREGLRKRLEKLGTPGTWKHITEQIGMFSFTGLTAKQVAYLAKEHHMYLLPNGRANMCALNDGNLDRFAEAVHDSVLKMPQ